MDKETIEHAAAYFTTAALAGLAGGLKYLRQVKAKTVTWSKWEFALQVATSVLAGYVAEWLFTAWKSEPHLIRAAVALAGWGGAQAIEYFSRKVGTDEAKS